MKKAFLTIAMAAFAFAANAQFIVGGNLGFNTQSGKSVETVVAGGTTTTTEFINPSSMDLYIMPKIGYQIDDKMSAGIILGYSMDSRTRTLTAPSGFDPLMSAAFALGMDDYAGTTKWSASTITIMPYFRYNLMEFNDLTLFCEAAIPIDIHGAEKTVLNEEGTYAGAKHTVTATEVDNKWNSFGITITPGLNYAFNEHLSMDIYFNAISLGYTMTKTTRNDAAWTDNFDNNTVTTTNDFGLNVRSLPAAVSFGVNYAF